ncbi:MAG: hypothetical protein IIZ99_00010 [Turicibacter sp.]|nr:hypothetical protein [Turicibacter sp.]
MKYYLQIKDEKILSYSNLPVMDEDVTNMEVEESTYTDYIETPEKYYVENGELKSVPDSDIREADFKAKFFEIPSYGWFRRAPKGYQSAVECLNLAYNNVTMAGSLPANTLIFYQQPDFTKPEECTEDWLIAHQTKNAEMTAQEFAALYAGFSVAWNNTEHN